MVMTVEQAGNGRQRGSGPGSIEIEMITSIRGIIDYGYFKFSGDN
jgi:hypothetical protein